MRQRFADETGPLAAVKAKDTLFEDLLARAAPCVNFNSIRDKRRKSLPARVALRSLWAATNYPRAMPCARM